MTIVLLNNPRALAIVALVGRIIVLGSLEQLAPFRFKRAGQVELADGQSTSPLPLLGRDLLMSFHLTVCKVAASASFSTGSYSPDSASFCNA